MKLTTRLDIERTALAKYFPKFQIQDPFGERRGVIGRMQSNNGREYVVWLALGAFPNEAPKLYLVSPEQLKTYDGRLLSQLGMNSEMHLRESDAHGHPQICHYNDQFWHPKVSLYKIIFKARLWIEAYEQHLQYGKPIEAYLAHMM